MKNKRNVLFFEGRKSDGKKSKIKAVDGEKVKDNAIDEIIDDSALIDCINQLNALRETTATNANIVPIQPKSEREMLEEMDKISAEMQWFSQWLTVKSQSVA